MGGSKLPDPLAATPLRPPLCPNCPALNPATPGDMGVCGGGRRELLRPHVRVAAVHAVHRVDHPRGGRDVGPLTVEEHLERGVVGGLGSGAKGDTGRAAAVAVAHPKGGPGAVPRHTPEGHRRPLGDARLAGLVQTQARHARQERRRAVKGRVEGPSVQCAAAVDAAATAEQPRRTRRRTARWRRRSLVDRARRPRRCCPSFRFPGRRRTPSGRRRTPSRFARRCFARRCRRPAGTRPVSCSRRSYSPARSRRSSSRSRSSQIDSHRP